MSGGPDRFIVTAPGRVNLIGEHTDYNEGFVLPLAIDRGLRISVRRRTDGRVFVHTAAAPTAVEFDLGERLAAGRADWGKYVVGVVAGFQRLGWAVPGFEAEITADLPAGAGLSSSAALEVGIATAIETLCSRPLDPVEKAVLCQRAEHEFAGVPCGIMDQFTVACAHRDHALFIDCRTHAVERVPLGAEVGILVIDSGVKHALADGGYAARRRECEAAARVLGRPALRDVSWEEWPAVANTIPESERRRARHVVSENDRVLAFTAAAGRRDWPMAGRLMAGSHASLRDDFEVSCPELDLVCDAVAAIDGVFGCRMTGGGFGGCAVALIDGPRASAVEAAARSVCTTALGREPMMFRTAAAAGARLLVADPSGIG